MISKSIRLTQEDAAGIQIIIDSDTRVEKGQSQALYYAFKDAAEDIPNWKEIAKNHSNQVTDYVTEVPYGETKSFSVESEHYEIVVESMKKQLNLEKIKVSYAARLCVQAYLQRMRDNTEFKRLNAYSTKVQEIKEQQKVNLSALLGKVLELYNSPLDEDQKKLRNIAKLLEVE